MGDAPNGDLGLDEDLAVSDADSAKVIGGATKAGAEKAKVDKVGPGVAKATSPKTKLPPGSTKDQAMARPVEDALKRAAAPRSASKPGR